MHRGRRRQGSDDRRDWALVVETFAGLTEESGLRGGGETLVHL